MFDLKEFALHREISQKKLAEDLGTDQSQVSLMMNGKRRIRLEHIERLREKYGDIVDEYRTDGKAKPQHEAVMSPNPVTLRDVQEDYTTEQESAVVVKPIPVIPQAVLRSPDKDIIEWTKTNEAHQKAHFFDIFNMFNLAKFAIKMDDDSMSPALCQNEYVLFRPIDHSTRIVNGKPYGIETTTTEAMIRILYDRGDSFLAVPLNKQYGDMEIPKNEIVRLHQPILHCSTRLSIVPDQTGEVLAKDGQIAQQSAQINSLLEDLGKSLDQLDKSGARVDRLIDMIEKKG